MNENIAAHLNLALKCIVPKLTHKSSHLTNIKDGKLIDKSLINWTNKGYVKENELMTALHYILLWYFELEHIKITWLKIIAKKKAADWAA